VEAAAANCPGKMLPGISCKVPEQVGVVLFPLEIVTGDQILDPLLDCLEVRLQRGRMQHTQTKTNSTMGTKEYNII
jgi:hypothetical protein